MQYPTFVYVINTEQTIDKRKPPLKELNPMEEARNKRNTRNNVRSIIVSESTTNLIYCLSYKNNDNEFRDLNKFIDKIFVHELDNYKLTISQLTGKLPCIHINTINNDNFFRNMVCYWNDNEYISLDVKLLSGYSIIGSHCISLYNRGNGLCDFIT